MKLYTIDSPYFNAGLVVEGGRVTKAAPILYRRFFNRTEHDIKALCAFKGWTWSYAVINSERSGGRREGVKQDDPSSYPGGPTRRR